MTDHDVLHEVEQQSVLQCSEMQSEPPQPRNIIVCCDGTSNDVTANSTNVLRLFRSLERNESQLAFYDSGVGTLADPTKITRLGKYCSRMIDQGVGHSVRENVCAGYRFLARNYRPGDRIYMFGFSRGAYTVRALAGMIHFLGLVRPELEHLDRLAWAVHSDDYDSLGKDRFHYGNRFRRAFAVDSHVDIHFVGVWDTVSSFGAPWSPRTVPNTANNPSIRHVRHAVSIDEHRGCFQPNLFYPKDPKQHTTFKQIWFAGSHADVGGGFPEAEAGLAKISLEWMYSEAEKAGCLINPSKKTMFLQPTATHGETSKPDPMAIAHVSSKDWLLIYKALEWLPQRRWNQTADKMQWFLPNVFRRRQVPEGAQLHLSVGEKIKKDAQYHPTNLPTTYSFSD
ncbi:MAG: hypothetical protein JWP89_3160 [Schlesneria sp.]|nr:hypothetical protein [Schlesneria sp.]